jgi:hemolysin III
MIEQQQESASSAELLQKEKPLLRGWFHALAAVGSVIFTIALVWQSRNDIPRLVSMLIFGLCMIELFAVSAVYHIIHWTPARRRVLRALDHTNIFLLIAGTYTPLCYNVLSGWSRAALLITIWLLAAAGVCLTIFDLRWHVPRWVNVVLYIGMGWVAVLALPAFLAVLPWPAVGVLVLGGLFYTIGAVIYARKRPDPLPHIFGYHEIFHLFVIAGGAAFASCIWIWALPFVHK